MYYGLAKKQDYFAERVNRFIAMASTPIANAYCGEYEDQVKKFLRLEELGVYNIGGFDASSATLDPVCSMIGGSICDEVRDLEESFTAAKPVKLLMHAFQNCIAQRFQEPQSLEKWAAGEIYTPIVDYANIDRVPVTHIHPIEDTLCDPVIAEYQFAQLGTKEKYLSWEKGGHISFYIEMYDDKVTRIVSAIENGFTVASAIKTSSVVITAVSLLGASSILMF